MYANGGTSEESYPPTAYRTHDWVGVDQTDVQLRQGLTIESHPCGRSSQLHLPFLISVADAIGGLFCGMEWSGAWYMRFKPVGGDRSSLSAGLKVNGMRLDPGQVLPLPDVHLGFFDRDFESGTNALRRYLYESVCPTYRGAPVAPLVSYDHAFGLMKQLSEKTMRPPG
jgi:hypothetical protein